MADDHTKPSSVLDHIDFAVASDSGALAAIEARLAELKALRQGAPANWKPTLGDHVKIRVGAYGFEVQGNGEPGQAMPYSLGGELGLLAHVHASGPGLVLVDSAAMIFERPADYRHWRAYFAVEDVLHPDTP